MVNLLFFLAIVFVSVRQGQSFLPASSHFAIRQRNSCLYTFSVEQPEPDKAANMGIREWPQQVKTSSYQETIDDGKEVTRYILEGQGSVEFESEGTKKKTTKVSPGTLVTATGPALLKWTVKEELIVLTPGYEQGGLFVGAAAVLVALIAVIALTSGSG